MSVDESEQKGGETYHRYIPTALCAVAGGRHSNDLLGEASITDILIYLIGEGFGGGGKDRRRAAGVWRAWGRTPRPRSRARDDTAEEELDSVVERHARRRGPW